MNVEALKKAESRVMPRLRFRESLMLYLKGSGEPFAYRSHCGAQSLPSGGRVICSAGGFEIRECGDITVCSYPGEPAADIAVAPLNGSELERDEIVRGMLRYIGGVGLFGASERSMISSERYFTEMIECTARFCGCGTDLAQSDPADVPELRAAGEMHKDSAYLAAVLPALALMYRRIAVRRGFNFKITCLPGVLCLTFSASVYSDGIGFPELAVLSEFERFCMLRSRTELKELDDSADGECVYRLSVGVLPVLCDRHDVLRASRLYENSKDPAQSIDLDVPGYY